MALTQRGVNGSIPLFLRPNLGDSVTALLRTHAEWRENRANKNADAGGMAIASGGRVVIVSRSNASAARVAVARTLLAATVCLLAGRRQTVGRIPP